jgi:hypothetical protein
VVKICARISKTPCIIYYTCNIKSIPILVGKPVRPHVTTAPESRSFFGYMLRLTSFITSFEVTKVTSSSCTIISSVTSSFFSFLSPFLSLTSFLFSFCARLPINASLHHERHFHGSRKLSITSSD